ncbi:UDP-3-O-(3-hydroxymyristoyl)glucosamine N-acyltransferase [Colwellia sp. MB3u-28]|uniref:UDP-3-O-(3-hydroxymyristoyl)glucosamine N-acyltransferase n=2 Tax=unclassified Colwellia TaxID=196834 RepID=UPI0015F688F1|nr:MULTISPECIES: UDP-3-O-(3-hydroxymyristoyl)glucosamine N-acyltransferase [unclassified Colwellia]MBA6254654.1 UDP-3-O-(3-hydroxymyristoyl)glucosamine N-acyltransferase [Colwellia sp. MB3u-28]MBA6259902.1 UDP-3-O-(3-hydroxymyristoyl)glucosamine N-acyltransferase [Colwellia sp. MB3u-41]MBA6305510.1 UDP-3-O-(3-hydroxymyristoyl)glucosamine N-acyltransferase [Colwellia sp. MB02u-14]
MFMSYTLKQLAEKIGAEVHGDASYIIHSLATLSSAGAQQIAFLANKKYSQQLSETKAGAVIISAQNINDCNTHALVMDNPYLGYALTAQLLDTTPKPAHNIHPSAQISPDVVLGVNVEVGANAVIEKGVVISDNVIIGAGCFIGEETLIGTHTKLWANVSVYHRVKIGQNCLIQANTVIGSDGFGYANDKGKWLKIPQLGGVIIGDNVEIGASTTIDRGALEDTVIKNGVILDNQIQIAHNVVIGENTAMAACSVIAGSTTIGKNCVIAGLVGINGHIEIGDGCVFTGMSMVTKNINEPGVYSSGMPCQTNKEWNKNNARIRKLESILKRIKSAEHEIEHLNNIIEKE